MVIKPYIRDVLSTFQYEKDEVRERKKEETTYFSARMSILYSNS
jgi:hypothetical protein